METNQTNHLTSEFLKAHKLTDKDVKAIEILHKSYGLCNGEKPWRSEGNENFLSLLLNEQILKYESLSKYMTVQFKKVFSQKFPQLTIDDNQFEKVV